MTTTERLARLRGPLTLAALCVTPVLLWARAAPPEERFATTSASLTSLGVLLALAGTTAFALNLVLGARLPVVERLFDGLDRMYRVHRRTGEVAFALLAGHVALILASRASVSTAAALDLLGPGAGWTVFAGVLAFSALTVSLLLTLVVRLGHELFVYVQRSFGFVFLLASYHVFTTPGAKESSPALAAYLGVVATAGVAAFLYRSVLGSLLVRRRPYRVTAVNRLDASVTEIVMEPLGRPLAFTPGQSVYVNFRSPALSEALRPVELSLRREVFSIRAGEARGQFHPFSITSAPGEPALRVTVKALGDWTRALRRLEPGAAAVVEGPYGSFSHRAVPSRRQVWAAGGIGITPFLSMARSLREDEELSVDLYYCVEHEAEAHFLPELRAIAARRRGFRVVLVPRDVDGFLTGGRIAAECPGLGDADVLVCGPPGMIDSLRVQLRAQGVRPERIHAEEFGFARIGRDDAAGRTRPAVPTGDRRLLALVGAVAFAGPALALLVVAGSYAASQAW